MQVIGPWVALSIKRKVIALCSKLYFRSADSWDTDSATINSINLSLSD